MGMSMSGAKGLLAIPAEHLPGLIALLLLPASAWMALSVIRLLGNCGVGWAEALSHRLTKLPATAKVALCALLVGATVHAALVPTHWSDARATALLFIADAIGFLAAFVWTIRSGRHWALIDTVMLGGTSLAYVFYVVRGWEAPDVVGLLTTTIELGAALIVVGSVRTNPALRRTRQPLVRALAIPLAFISMLGTAAVAGASQSAAPARPSQRPGASSTSGPSFTSPMPGMGASPAAATPLSLPTTSAAGPITWPDEMSSMARGMEMVTPNCIAQPSSSQQRAAVNLVDQTVAAVAPYESLAAARSAGYIPVTRPGQRVVHYINPSIYRDGQSLHPTQVPALVYVNTSHGAVLSAAMYLAPPTTTGSTPPQPGGCLTQWHIHTDLCFNAGHVVGNNDSGSCSAGSFNQTTQPMMHVWLTPVPGGPLAPDPPPAAEVLAAGSVVPPNPPNGTA
jgi:hypothetical protein